MKLDNRSYLEYLLVCGKIDKERMEKSKDLINSYMDLKSLVDSMYVKVLDYPEMLGLLSKLNKYRKLKKEELEFITTNMRLMQEVFGDSINYKLRILDINYAVNEADNLQNHKLKYLKKKLNRVKIKGLARNDRTLKMFNGRIRIKSKTVVIDGKEHLDIGYIRVLDKDNFELVSKEHSNVGHVKVLDKDNFELVSKDRSKTEEDIDTLKIKV